MWERKIIQLKMGVPADNVTTVTAHPWVYGLGQQTLNGVYLSPDNAVRWLAKKLVSLADSMDVVVLMVAGQTYDEFMTNLEPLTAVFPAPAFKQVSRLARSAAELETVKMQIPAKAENSLPDPLPLSVTTTRAMSTAAAVASAAAVGSLSLTGLKASLVDFMEQRAGLLSEIAEAAGELAGKSASAWVFTSTGSGTEMVRELLTDIPAMSSIYTAAIMLTGSDLSSIRRMIHDSDHAGA
ncbi:hypothetical protein [Leclercia sp. LSNIH1]|uniref:hypothetical protein n=1 Tax=Leclercia sp. LSNIH1 TaxID=1920114 RepID=UPI000CD00A81|nr:hypothetical protein [Leclercia sp. LSNIH1]AUU86842.1 hypothetical protein C2U54_01280 [Leclercia sp. LSNIH1]POV34980.1 hypothetical protein C3388_09305 [Leclercia sp. LSNIH5]POW63140.1 hypothetical protein C3389_19865 [Leclercia sp. LSNIH2]